MALERFIPLSPDPNITTSSDMGMAQFGHLNTILDYLNGTNALTNIKIDGTLFFNSYSGGTPSIIITHSSYNQNPLNYIGGGATLIIGGYYSQYLTTPYNQGYGNTVIGIYASIVAHDNSYFNTVIGYGASITIHEPGNVVIGKSATSGGADNTVIGRSAIATSYNSIVIGKSASVTSGSSVAIGNGATTSTTYGFALGNSNSLLQIGGNFVPTARVHVKGLGSTSATTSLLVQNSSGNNAFQVKDDLNANFQGRIQIEYDKISFLGSPSNTYIQQSLGIGYGYYSAAISNQIMINSQPKIIVKDTGGSQASTLIVGHNVPTTDAADPSALLEVRSDATYLRGFLPPRMTTAQKNAIATPAAGLVVYDTNLNKLCVYTTAWQTITSA